MPAPPTPASSNVDRGVLTFELGVSDRSKAYVPIYGEIVAQFDVRKALILLDNPGFGIPYFEPDGRVSRMY
jgi:hypothetical protein